jgi:RimJ/RimL family protein N-acetyltransferase
MAATGVGNPTYWRMDLEKYWPLFGLRIATPRLELRIPNDADLGALVAAAKAGVHDPDTMPFAVPWTDLVSPEFERSALQYHWSARSQFRMSAWDLGFVVVLDGEVIGMQGLHAKDFVTLRSIETGSWLGLRWQGQGIGKEMRAAIVQFGFDHLCAEEITSAAMLDNKSSQRVSAAIGYEPNGTNTIIRRGERVTSLRFRLTRERWQATRRDDTAINVPISVTGFEECRNMLGL